MIALSSIRSVEIEALSIINPASIRVLDLQGPRWIAKAKCHGENPCDIFILANGPSLMASFALRLLPEIIDWYYAHETPTA
jgi:hypothetical protein